MGYARPFDLDLSAPIERAGSARAETEKLLGLELLRFVSAMAVLLFHFDHFARMAGMPPVARADQPLYALLWPLYDFGQYGVQVFWGISGYIFFWKYGAAVHQRTVAAKEFFWLRVSRLYPLHLATLVAVVGMQAAYRQLAGHDYNYAANDPRQFVDQLFLATDWGPQQPFSFNGPVWSISAEVAVYAAFFLALRRFGPSVALCLGAIIAGLALQEAGLNWVSLFCATYFFAGGLAALAGRRAVVPAAILLIFLTLAGIATGEIGDRDKLPTFLLVAVPCLLVIAAREWPKMARWPRALQFAGNLTYSSYMLHFPLQLMLAIGVIASGAVVPITSPWFLCAYLGTTLGVSALSYRWFELPAQGWIRQRTIRRAA